MTTLSHRPSRNPPRRTRSRAPILVAVGVAVVVLIALVIALTAGGDDGATTGGSGYDPATTGTVAASGTPLPPLTDSAPDPAAGMTFPTLTGADQQGQPLTISAGDGPIMVLFMAHWCPHCQRELPVVQRWVDGGGLPAGVRLVSVSTAIDPQAPNYPPDRWLARVGWTAPVLVDADGTAAEAAGLSAYPYFVAVDGTGKVVQRTTGKLTTAQLDAIAQALAPAAG